MANIQRSWKLYKIHSKFCNDKWYTPVCRSSFQNRLTRYWDEKKAVFTPNKWHWWNRWGKDTIKDMRRDYVKRSWHKISYTTYLNRYKNGNNY